MTMNLINQPKTPTALTLALVLGALAEKPSDRGEGWGEGLTGLGRRNVGRVRPGLVHAGKTVLMFP